MYVEEAFGARNCKSEDRIMKETKQLFDRSCRTNMKGILLSHIDTLTNRGLYLIAMVLTRGSVNFERTRKKMKKVTKELIQEVFGDQNRDNDQLEIFTQLSQLLNNTQYVRENCLTSLIPKFQSHYIAAIKILDGLEDLPIRALLAMCRKLRGVPAGITYLNRDVRRCSRDNLIYKIRRRSDKMLSELGHGDELQAPLAKALAIASLSLKLTAGCPNSFVTDFNQFSPEVKTLQNEIAKAIWLLKTRKVRLPELKTIQLLLDPKPTDISNRSLRIAIKKLFTDYLFECSDLDTIPKPLSEALTIINKSFRSTSSGCHLKGKIEEDVECILSLSAQIKQVVCDFLPDNAFDEDFTDAYMEELEESDNGEEDDDGGLQPEIKKSQHRSSSIDLDHPEESCGEYIAEDSKLPISAQEESCGPSLFCETRNLNGTLKLDINHFEVQSMAEFETLRINGNSFSPHLCTNRRSIGNSIRRNKPEHSTTMDLGNPLDLPPTYCFKGENSMFKKQSTCNNVYLGIQEVCDETSMVAYNLIGYIMERLAQEEGLDLDWGDSSYLKGEYSYQENQGIKNAFPCSFSF